MRSYAHIPQTPNIPLHDPPATATAQPWSPPPAARSCTLAPYLPSPLHPMPGVTTTGAKGWSESEGQEEGEQEQTKGG